MNTKLWLKAECGKLNAGCRDISVALDKGDLSSFVINRSVDIISVDTRL